MHGWHVTTDRTWRFEYMALREALRVIGASRMDRRGQDRLHRMSQSLEIGCAKSFNGRPRDELHNGEAFYSLGRKQGK
jgi:hypothetical protein